MASECILFYTPETKELAEEVAKLTEASSPNRVTLGEIVWKNFDDGFPDIFIKDAESIRNKHVGFLATFNDKDKIFEQMSLIYTLPRLFVGSFTLVLPFFPTGTMERVDKEGQVATAYTMARIVSHIPLSRGGPTSLVTYDIHALQERFYFGDSVLPLFLSGIPLLKETLAKLPDFEDITIAFPDDGAHKRFHEMFTDFPHKGSKPIICTKVRQGDQRIVTVKEGQPAGRHVLIIDDLVQSGGTLIQCAAALKEMKAKCVSAYVTHAVFPKASWEKFCCIKAGETERTFKHFFITNSCPKSAKAVEGKEPFHVISLAPSIREALLV